MPEPPVPPRPTAGERLATQFSPVNAWNRIGRALAVGLSYMAGLGKPPIAYSFTEWCFLGSALVGAVWTNAPPPTQEE